jgi:hypothetical protein
MATEPQIQASRANGAHSRGPVTAQGKFNSSKNRTRHGLLARTIVMDSESLEGFEQLLNSYREEFDLETSLVETMAIARGRYLRVCHMQRATLDIEMARQESSASAPPIRAAGVFRTLSDNSHALDLLLRYETAFERQFTRALRALLQLQSRPGRGPDPDLDSPISVTWVDPEWITANPDSGNNGRLKK